MGFDGKCFSKCSPIFYLKNYTRIQFFWDKLLIFKILGITHLEVPACSYTWLVLRNVVERLKVNGRFMVYLTRKCKIQHRCDHARCWNPVSLANYVWLDTLTLEKTEFPNHTTEFGSNINLAFNKSTRPKYIKLLLIWIILINLKTPCERDELG